MVDCKNCGSFMGMEEVEEDDGTIKVTFACLECDTRAQGYYNPELQDPDPLFWEDGEEEGVKVRRHVNKGKIVKAHKRKRAKK